jgi:hypothetical protein
LIIYSMESFGLQSGEVPNLKGSSSKSVGIEYVLN